MQSRLRFCGTPPPSGASSDETLRAPGSSGWFLDIVIRRWLVAMLLGLVTASMPAAAQDVTLELRPGLGGIARPGRWMPLLVTVDSQSAIEGRLLVEWGAARVSRTIRVAPGAPAHLTLYLRTTEVRSAISARLSLQGRDIASASTTVRLSGTDTPVTACTDAKPEATSISCTVSVPPTTAPLDWRGYDAADRVAPDEMPVLFSTEQRAALTLWRRVRELEDAGAAAVAGDIPSTTPPGLQRAGLLLAFPSALLLAAIGASLMPRRAFVTGIALLTATAGMTAAAALLGRSSAITVHHASTLEAFDDSRLAIAHMRAVATFPAAGHFALAGASPFLTIDRTTFGQAPLDEQFDESGRPLLTSRFGLGERQPFILSGSTPLRVLTAEATASGVRVVNVSPFRLDACEWPSIFGTAPHHLEPGASVTALQLAEEPVSVTCRMAGPPAELLGGQHRVSMTGSTTVALRLKAGSPQR